MLNGLQKAKPAGAAGPEEPVLELLAHYELEESGTGKARSGFAVILELTDRRLLIESDVELASGQEIQISFFLPNHKDASRVNVALDCAIAQCRDQARLHYSTRISKISDAARAAILNFQATRG
jgi:hypothetical protein